jgi:uncharacterized membrane protein YedE/YeeE
MVRTPNFGVVVLLFMIGIGSLYRFSQHLLHLSSGVRMVDIVGVAGGGAACGAAIFALVFLLMARKLAPQKT